VTRKPSRPRPARAIIYLVSVQPENAATLSGGTSATVTRPHGSRAIAAAAASADLLLKIKPVGSDGAVRCWTVWTAATGRAVGEDV